MEVNVVVSTVDGILDAGNYPPGDYKVIIINQGTPMTNLVFDDRFIIINSNDSGLSNSRNEGLKHVLEGELVLFTDNDVRLFSGFEKILIEDHSKFSEDILTYKCKDIYGFDFKNNYKEKSFIHNRISIMRVSSIEISIKKSDNIINFDSRFGLGASIPIGEENIFLSDNIKNGNNARYLPKYVGAHLDENHSGEQFSLYSFKLRYQVFVRLFGPPLGIILFLLFNIKNAQKYFRR